MHLNTQRRQAMHGALIAGIIVTKWYTHIPSMTVSYITSIPESAAVNTAAKTMAWEVTDMI